MGSRLFKDAVAPLIKNHGYAVVNKLTGVNMQSNASVANTTVRWAKLRDYAVAMIYNTQRKQQQIIVQAQRMDKQIAQLDQQINR